MTNSGDFILTAKKHMYIFILIEKSSSMSYSQHLKSNETVRKIASIIKDLGQNYTDYEFKTEVLIFSNDADNQASLGDAYRDLNGYLSASKGVMQSINGIAAPAIILISANSISEDYDQELSRIKSNKWFLAARKIAIVLDESVNSKQLYSFTGDSDAVLTIKDKDIEILRRIIKPIDVTSSGIGIQKPYNFQKTESANVTLTDTSDDSYTKGISECKDHPREEGFTYEATYPKNHAIERPLLQKLKLLESRLEHRHDELQQIRERYDHPNQCSFLGIGYHPTIDDLHKEIGRHVKETKEIEEEIVTTKAYLNAETVYSSVFAPSEVKRTSNIIVQLYLHKKDETDLVSLLANEAQKDAERRSYTPLSLKLNNGDKVDIEFNIYGQEHLLSERKSLIWSGSFTKCSFRYFVPANIDVNALYCEANLMVNGAIIGEMCFTIQIVGYPRNLNSEIISHRFNKIFVSYAHADTQIAEALVLAYKSQGMEVFFDKQSLMPGEIFEEIIFDRIDSSDVFVLCWSQNAAASDYVIKEKNRALLHAYPQKSVKDATLKIIPISIQPKADLPEDMIDIYHFANIE